MHGGGPGFESPQLHRHLTKWRMRATTAKPGCRSCEDCWQVAGVVDRVAGRRARRVLVVERTWDAGDEEEPRRRHTVDALAPAADEGRGHATIRLGERRARNDPRMSEWGNPAEVDLRHPRLNT